MRLSTVVVAAPLAAVSTATPISPGAASTFTIDQVTVFRPAWNFQQSVLKTYARYNATPPLPVVRLAVAAAGSASGSVSATPQAYDQSYLSPVTIGNSQVNLNFDTGSSDLWTFSTRQPGSQTLGHRTYNPSTGALISGATWSIDYISGTGATGVVYADRVQTGPMTATSQAVQAATSVSSEYLATSAADGSLGFAFPALNSIIPTQQTTFWDNAKGSLAAPLFAVRLRHRAAGSFNFGFVNDTLHTGDISYVAVDSSSGRWGFTAGGYAIGNAGLSGSIGAATADTGITLFYLPASIVAAYYTAASAATFDSNFGAYVLPCTGYTPPNFSVQVGASTITLPGSYLVSGPTDETEAMCYGGIQPNTGLGYSIFGLQFFQAAYVVFDQSGGVNRLGFAQGA